MSSESVFSKKEISLLAILAVIAMILVTVAVVPGLRTSAKALFSHQDRQILAKISGDIRPQGPHITVLKIKTEEGLSLEIYSVDKTEGMTLMAKIPLSEKRDGYFSLKGNATNLALTDVDQDGAMEIVAPTYDDQMVPRLNIFKYNAESKHFERVNAPENSGL